MEVITPGMGGCAVKAIGFAPPGQVSATLPVPPDATVRVAGEATMLQVLFTLMASVSGNAFDTVPPEAVMLKG